MKKITAIILCFCICVAFCACGNTEQKNEKLKIVTTIFPIYDFARAVAGERADITMLIKPASEVHAFEPSPSDIKAVYGADAFFYIGGESDTWVKTLLDGTKGQNIALIESVDLLYEDEHKEYDGHIWTSPENAKKMVDKIREVLEKIDSENAEFYSENAENYNLKISDVSNEIKEIVKQSDTKFLLVADRFPFKYFAIEFGLEYKAPFGGCANSSDVSLKVMNELADAVEEHNLSAAFYVEMSNKNIANALAETTGVELYELHSAHNVTVDDFSSGVTYVDIMRRNCDALRKGIG